MGLTNTAIHWTPVVLPQENFGFPAIGGNEMHLGTVTGLSVAVCCLNQTLVFSK